MANAPPTKLRGRNTAEQYREQIERLEAENAQLRELVIKAYDGDPPTNGWRERAERLNAWPGAHK